MGKDAEDPKFVSSGEFARFCQVDIKTIHNWATKGKIAFFRTPGGHLRFERPVVVAFLKAHGYPMPKALQAEPAAQPAPKEAA